MLWKLQVRESSVGKAMKDYFATHPSSVCIQVAHVHTSKICSQDMAGKNTQLSSFLSVSLFCFCLFVVSGSHITIFFPFFFSIHFSDLSILIFLNHIRDKFSYGDSFHVTFWLFFFSLQYIILKTGIYQYLYKLEKFNY